MKCVFTEVAQQIDAEQYAGIAGTRAEMFVHHVHPMVVQNFPHSVTGHDPDKITESGDIFYLAAWDKDDSFKMALDKWEDFQNVLADVYFGLTKEELFAEVREMPHGGVAKGTFSPLIHSSATHWVFSPDVVSRLDHQFTVAESAGSMTTVVRRLFAQDPNYPWDFLEERLKTGFHKAAQEGGIVVMFEE